MQILTIALFLILPSPGSLLSLPAFFASHYKPGSRIPVYYNKIFSEKTQLPFAYSQLPFTCNPVNSSESRALNFGELFQGDRIVQSDIVINTLVNTDCSVLCRLKDVHDKQWSRARRLIEDEYRVEWIMDGLPGATKMLNSKDGKIEYEPGFLFGYKDKDHTYLYNFFEINIPYRNTSNGDVLIIGFEIVPKSIQMENKCKSPEDSAYKLSEVIIGESKSVSYAYSVRWTPEESVEWQSRWNMYIENSNPKVHWYSIVNSLMLLTVLTSIVAFILLAALKKDISAYNEEDALENQEDSMGWKLVHGDVFRAPRNWDYLSILLGTGIQLLSSAGFTLLFAVIGILNPSYRGGQVQYGVFFFAVCGMFGGYHAVRLNKSFWPLKNWTGIGLMTASCFPLFIFLVICIVNTFYWSQDSSNALPVGTFVALISIWLFINLPLTLLGAYFGNKKQPIEHPVRTNQIPRQIPEQVWYLKTHTGIFIGGLIPFTVIFMELFFILKSLWQDQYYYMYGFLALVLVLLVVTIVEVTIAMIYFQLFGEDYRWQWKSFLIASGSVWYILVLGTFYFLTRLDAEHGFSSVLYFFSYLITGLVVYFIISGTIGFLAVYWFLRRIYSALKVD